MSDSDGAPAMKPEDAPRDGEDEEKPAVANLPKAPYVAEQGLGDDDDLPPREEVEGAADEASKMEEVD